MDVEQIKDAEAAASFFKRCQFHTHVGMYDCDDKYVVYFSRDGGLAELFSQTLPKDWAVVTGKTADRSSSACIIYDYARQIDPEMIVTKLERFQWARVEASKDDAWILQHADEMKAALLDLAKIGAPPPSQGTLLARALELFTTE